MENNNSNKLAKNTLLLFIRMAISLLISLYTSRVILNALGIDDYGTYNAVAGFMSMFAIFSNSLTSAISRYLTFELGKGNICVLKETFSASIIIEVVLSLIIVVLAETIGLWFVNNKMTIPDGRLFAANVIFQISIITFVVNLISVPYNACIISHERMNVFAFVGITKSIATLAISLLVANASLDRLILYSVLLLVIAIVERLFYNFYCSRNFQECHVVKLKRYTYFKDIFSFAGWNFFGAGSAVLRDQGINVLINIFCGPAVNAARGIAMQVSGAVSQFSNSLVTAINPQITKSYASGQIDYTISLVNRGAKLTFFLLLIVSTPVVLETDYLLKLWLKVVPDYSVVFVKLILIYLLTECISYSTTTLMLATGDIKVYQILVGGCQLLNFPLAYVLLKNGFEPQYTILCNIFIAFACLLLRLILLKKKMNFSVGDFVIKVLFRIIIVSVITIMLSSITIHFLREGFVRLVVTSINSVVVSVIVIYFLGLDDIERKFCVNLFKKIILR